MLKCAILEIKSSEEYHCNIYISILESYKMYETFNKKDSILLTKHKLQLKTFIKIVRSSEKKD